MPIDITRYAIERLREREARKKEPGPVITISREFGCPSKLLAELLVKELKNRDPSRNAHKWHWVSKEILKDAAAKLGLTPKEIKYVFEYKERSVFDEILVAQSRRYYHSDKKIRKTIGEVIRALGWEGYVVIVGRAGAALTREIPKSLHIRLMAPMQWRLDKIAETKKISIDEAGKLIQQMDERRRKFMNYYLSSGQDLAHIFDLILNCSTLSLHEMAEIICHMGKIKKLI